MKKVLSAQQKDELGLLSPAQPVPEGCPHCEKERQARLETQARLEQLEARVRELTESDSFLAWQMAQAQEEESEVDDNG